MPAALVHPLFLFFAIANVYGCALVVALATTKGGALIAAPFSNRKFYLLMGWAPLTFAVLAALVSPRYLALFLVAGLAGILGEIAVALLWRGFFRIPIWTYSHRAVLSGHTSTLNFLPWAVGALLFQLTGRAASSEPGSALAVLRPMLVSAVALAAGLALAWPARRHTSARDGTFSGLAFAVFCAPIGLTALALGLAFGPRYPLLMTAFAIVGFATEYGYGRGMSLFFERGLWTYNHLKIDGGHTSFVTLPLWALGGLYFHFIAACLGL